ncbi:MAG: hypothetical protein ACREEC_13045, partial [Thermoplasmata archaeon]
MSARAQRVSQSLQIVDGEVESAGIEAAYADDQWRATRLGVPAPRGKDYVSFAGISQPWLRHAAKSWARRRLATGSSTFSSVVTATGALGRFSRFLAECRPPVVTPASLTRDVLERYLSWLSRSGLAANTRIFSLVVLRGLLEDNRRHRWLADIPADAVLYRDDLPRYGRPVPRFVAESVMAQLENDANLDEARP